MKEMPCCTCAGEAAAYDDDVEERGGKGVS